MRRLRVLLWAGGLVLGLAAEWFAFGLDDPGGAIPDLVTGWVVLASGLIAWSRRPGSRRGPLLAATGATWFAGNFADAALYLHRGPLVHVLLADPNGRVASRVDRVAVGVGYAVAVVAPAWESEVMTLVLTTALGLVAVLDHRASVGVERRARAASLAMIVLVLAAGAAARLAFPAGDADDPALLAYQIALCAVAVGLASGVASRERAPVTDLVIELGEARSGTMRDALARALGDPTLELGYWAPGPDGYVVASGRPLRLPEPGSGRSVTLVERDGEPLAALVHDPAVLADPVLVDSIAAATRLAAANARLQAALRAQVAEVEGSRRRLLAAADDERRRLEQRMRLGVERRLAALVETLEQARRGACAGESARIARAEDVLARAREDLRELARGLDPASLSEAGLAGTLAALAEASAVPVELTVPGEPLEREAEATVYFVCAEALANVTKHARATRVTIAVVCRDGAVTVEIADDGVGGADPERGSGLLGLGDRLQACGGRLRIDSPEGGGTRLAAEIPLGGGAR